MKDFTTKDRGARETFASGSERDTRTGKGRFDLLPPEALFRLARLYERGAEKYAARNWEKGQPLSRLLDSAMRHLVQLLAGQTDEDHAAAVAWNVFAFMALEERIEAGGLTKLLDDRPHPVVTLSKEEGKKPAFDICPAGQAAGLWNVRRQGRVFRTLMPPGDAQALCDVLNGFVTEHR